MFISFLKEGFTEEVHWSRGMKDELELPEGMMNGKIILGKGTSYVRVWEKDKRILIDSGTENYSVWRAPCFQSPQFLTQVILVGTCSSINYPTLLTMAWATVGSTKGKSLLRMVGETWWMKPESLLNLWSGAGLIPCAIVYNNLSLGDFKASWAHMCHLTFLLTNTLLGF